MNDREGYTKHTLQFVVAIDIELPPEGSAKLAECWDGATTHAQALQHECDVYTHGSPLVNDGQPMDLIELLAFAPYDVLSATHSLENLA